jgi:hypothetical protein
MIEDDQVSGAMARQKHGFRFGRRRHLCGGAPARPRRGSVGVLPNFEAAAVAAIGPSAEDSDPRPPNAAAYGGGPNEKGRSQFRRLRAYKSFDVDTKRIDLPDGSNYFAGHYQTA